MTPATVRFSFLFFLFRVRCASLRARFRRSACRARRCLLYYIIIIIIFTIIIDVVLCGARVNAVSVAHEPAAAATRTAAQSASETKQKKKCIHLENNIYY